MLRLTIGVFGNPEQAEQLASDLGKKGTENDILIFNHYSSDAAMNIVTPKGEKIQSLLQALAMTDIPVIVVNELTPELGEQLIAIDEFKFKKGFVISSIDISQFTKNTSIEKFTQITKDALREELLKQSIERPDSPVRIPIDNYFDVKSVGFVMLGIVKSGSVKKYDKLIIEPLGKEVLIKSIQSNDKEIDHAEKGTRVGLNIKGITSDEMKRGFVVADSMEKTKTLSVKINQSKFSKAVLKKDEHIGVLSGLLFTTGVIQEVSDKVTIELQHEIPMSDKYIFTSTKNILPRIIGSS